MKWLRAFCSRVASIFAARSSDREIAAELDSHLALHVDDLVRRGLDPQEARRQALIKLGGLEPVKERYRERRGLPLIETTLQDVRYALRLFLRTPGFSLVAVLTLAIGIGAVTVIYSVVHNVVLDPLPYRDSDRLVNVVIDDLQRGGRRGTMSAPEFLDFEEQSSVFEGVIGTQGVSARYETRDMVEYLRGVWVTPNFFDFMGLAPLVGRTFGPEDGRPGSPPVAVLRYRAWAAHFNRDPAIVGKTILINGEQRTVVGVMPPRFTWHAADLWMARPLERGAPDAAAARPNFQARLRRGVSIAEAEAQLELIAARRARERPGEYPEKFRVQVINVIEATVGAFIGVLYTALGAVGLLLLIACCNVANMLLAKATTREREMTMRAALGAGRGRIIRQLLIESLLLALAGAAAGCAIAYAGIDALVALLPESPLPGEVDIRLNSAVLGFSLATTVACALLFGLAPALYGARRDLVHGLKSAGPGVLGGRSGLRNALVVAEIALSIVLLLGAGLLMRTFVALVRVDLGFDPANILVAPVGLPPSYQAAPDEKRRFYALALERVTTLPGVAAVAATTGVPPFGGGSRSEVEIAGEQLAGDNTAAIQWCSDGYFRALGIGLLRGEAMSAAAGGEAPRTAVVNQAFVATYLPHRDPLGVHMRLPSAAKAAELPWNGDVEIVGIVPDVRNHGLRDDVGPHVYLHGAFPPRSNPLLIARTTADPMLLLNAIRREIRSVEPRAALVQPATVEALLERFAYAQPRFSLFVLGAFAAIGTLLVAVGVFSVLAYNVSRQRREIAVRMALGAGPKQIGAVVFRLIARLLAIGILSGALGSVAMGRLLTSQLWNTSPYDAQALAAAIAIIVSIACAAGFVPARRAMRIEPMAALRQD